MAFVRAPRVAPPAIDNYCHITDDYFCSRLLIYCIFYQLILFHLECSLLHCTVRIFSISRDEEFKSKKQIVLYMMIYDIKNVIPIISLISLDFHFISITWNILSWKLQKQKP